MSTLDPFVRSSRSIPKVLATSQEIRDRSSTFVGTIYRAATEAEARSIVKHHRHVVHGAKPASHEITAWRCMVLKEGKSGLEGPDDFEVRSGSDDDGEKYGGAKVLKVMQTEGVLDAVVIVSRWYGGIMLGPIRFTHIETCAREVCRAYKTKEEMDECLAILASLDEELANLRQELAQLSPKPTPDPVSQEAQPVQVGSARGHSAKPSYDALTASSDIAKGRRLINARESAIRSLKALIAKKRATDVPST
ncbi:hypothetical protein JAAARDRAFT_134366 [Jaapia argillacea MUCL 33604]|uniref:Impact N-terminal domain-containing protein n=1 Tax=Jaapia argillacea MUCL 33604 TaxID=933084 RepID=A0A067PKA6_9AGAM|nr:hypothetical protein JAAARDRAFT_134366 [Jaapia argillacea MUCL 33604]